MRHGSSTCAHRKVQVVALFGLIVLGPPVASCPAVSANLQSACCPKDRTCDGAGFRFPSQWVFRPQDETCNLGAGDNCKRPPAQAVEACCECAAGTLQDFGLYDSGLERAQDWICGVLSNAFSCRRQGQDVTSTRHNLTGYQDPGAYLQGVSELPRSSSSQVLGALNLICLSTHTC